MVNSVDVGCDFRDKHKNCLQRGFYHGTSRVAVRHANHYRPPRPATNSQVDDNSHYVADIWTYG